MSISSLARALADEILGLEPPRSPRSIRLPDRDDEPVRGEELGHAEGQSFVIEYLDAAGRSSTRRVTVWSIVAGANGVPALYARCHERSAMRQFRVDRIQSCIDFDGEVFEDVPLFLADNFGMALTVARRKVDDRWSQVRSNIWQDAVLLAALARSDGRVRLEEVEVAQDHLSRLGEQTGIMLDGTDIAAIGRYVARLRPTEDAINRALTFLSSQGDARIRRLLLAAAALVDADGKRHAREIELINVIAVDLLGIPVM